MFAWLKVCFFLSSCKTLVLRVSKFCSGGTTVNLLSVDLRFPSWRRIDILINSVNVFFLDSATRCLKHRQQQQPNPCPGNNPSQRLGPKGVSAWKKQKSIDSIVRCVSFSELQHWLKNTASLGDAKRYFGQTQKLKQDRRAATEHWKFELAWGKCSRVHFRIEDNHMKNCALQNTIHCWLRKS